MKYILLSLLVITSCSFKKTPAVNQASEGHEELYSMPDAPEEVELKPNIKRIIIAATNDMEGNYSVQQFRVKDDSNAKTEQTIQIGGEDAVASYFKILRDHYKNVLLVDSGDIFSPTASIEMVQEFYHSHQYDAITLGLGDFNLKLPPKINSYTQLFQEFASSSSTPLILSNLYNLKSGRHVEWKGTHPYLLKEVDGVKVGIIGLVPDDIATLTPVDNRVALFVENMLQSTLRQGRLLRSLGAQVVVVLTHQGLSCGREQAHNLKLPLDKVNFEPAKENVCDLSSPLGTFLERLPPNLVDVVISGRNHEKVANIVNNTLVMGNFGKGKSFSFAELYVDTKENKVLLDQSIIQQPVMFCREFFKETKDCYFEDLSIDHKERIPATFLGKPIQIAEESEPAVTDNFSKVDYEKAVNELEVDIAYISPTTLNTQLIALSIEGRDLVKILEEDFNSQNDKSWIPSPFEVNGEYLHLSLRGEEIKADKTYSILADLEGIQGRKVLKKHLLNTKTKSIKNQSWSSYSERDVIQTKMAAQVR